MAGPYIRGSKNRVSVPALIANESLFRLMDNLVWPRLANRTYEKYFADKIGDRITVKRPYQARVNSGRVLADTDIAPIIDKTVDILINKRHNFALRYNDEEATLDIVAFGQRYLQTGVEELAYEFDKAGADELGLGLHYSEGTPGTGMTTSAAQLIGAHARHVAIPLNSMNYGVLDPMDFAAISNDVRALQLPPDDYTEAIRSRFQGMLGNWKLFESVAIPYLEVQDNGASTPLVNRPQVGMPASPATYVAPQYEGNMIPTDGWANSTKVMVEGQLFKISGVKEIQPRGRRRTTGRDFTFCCAADVTSNGSGVATIPITTDLNAGGLTTEDSDGTVLSLNAFQNVSAAAGDNAAITLVGTEGKTYRQGVFYEKSALEYANVQLETFQSAVLQGQATDDQTGVSVSLVGWFDGNNMRETQRIDIFFGVKNIYPELGIRHVGSEVG